MKFFIIMFAVILAIGLRTAVSMCAVWLVFCGLNGTGITHVEPSVTSLFQLGLGLSFLVGVNDIKVDAR